MSTCYSCFREYENSAVCPHCGVDISDQPRKYPHALSPGTIVGGQYIIGRVLGQGGFGITYAAQDYNSKNLVAIKEFLPEQFAARNGSKQVNLYSAQHENDFKFGKENFLAEAKTLSQFNGLPNICDIYSYFEENGTAYFVMEYVDGISMSDYMKSKGGRLDVEEAKALLIPVMKALGNVHAKGIIHRDIAPDNIMVCPDGKVTLIDFGAARYSMGEKSRSLDVILKHGFAPKEQYTRHGRQGPYTDVYAIAATFYYAITGKLPPEAIDRINNEEVILPSALGAKISEAEEDALLKGLSVEAPARYQSMAEFIAALTGETHSEPKTAEAPAAKKRDISLPQQISLKPKYLAAAAIALVVIIIAAFLMGRGSGSSPAAQHSGSGIIGSAVSRGEHYIEILDMEIVEIDSELCRPNIKLRCMFPDGIAETYPTYLNLHVNYLDKDGFAVKSVDMQLQHFAYGEGLWTDAAAMSTYDFDFNKEEIETISITGYNFISLKDMTVVYNESFTFSPPYVYEVDDILPADSGDSSKANNVIPAGDTKNPVAVEQAQLINNGSYIEVKAKIRNMGDVKRDVITVYFQLLDKNGDVLADERVNVMELEPGQAATKDSNAIIDCSYSEVDSIKFISYTYGTFSGGSKNSWTTKSGSGGDLIEPYLFTHDMIK